MNFAEKFCAKNQIQPEDFVPTVLRLTLRPAARSIRTLLSFNPDYFAADREFVRGVGRISRLEDFNSEAEDFMQDPDARGFLHQRLGLRVSRRRLRHLVRDTLAG
jgi:hypothetical protein